MAATSEAYDLGSTTVVVALFLLIPVLLVLWPSADSGSKFWNSLQTVGGKRKDWKALLDITQNSLFQTKDWVADGYRRVRQLYLFLLKFPVTDGVLVLQAERILRGPDH